MILIEHLSFKIENTNTEEDYSNCKETNQLTTNFNNLRSKYDDLLEEYSKTNKILIDIQNDPVLWHLRVITNYKIMKTFYIVRNHQPLKMP